MTIDPDNTVVRLCAEGIAVEGSPQSARALFAQAWAVRRDDYEACIAAHYMARQQDSPEETLHWNTLAVSHAEAVSDGRARSFLASLYLNLAESYRLLGRRTESSAAVERGRAALIHCPAGGYRQFVAGGLDRVAARLLGDDVA